MLYAGGRMRCEIIVFLTFLSKINRPYATYLIATVNLITLQFEKRKKEKKEKKRFSPLHGEKNGQSAVTHVYAHTQRRLHAGGPVLVRDL